MNTKYFVAKKILASSVIIFCASQIISCSPISTKDGPPLRDVDPNKIENAVPKDEAKSPYGNPNIYNVNGKNYRVLKSSKHYNKKGMASWYGRGFQGHLTSTNEYYNMFAMTAASPELPLPTYVKVTNLENGRKVIVKVNDRGPFKKNRILDLSYVAAKKLGFSDKGTALVKVTAINSAKMHNIVKHEQFASNTNKSGMYLHVGEFSNSHSAKRVSVNVAELTNKNVHLNSSNHKNKTIYKIEVGPIATLAENDKLQKLLSDNGYSFVPVTK